jgi:D-glycero-D-manno-heptose 1,7-bisphosphate phosphatase
VSYRQRTPRSGCRWSTIQRDEINYTGRAGQHRTACAGRTTRGMNAPRQAVILAGGLGTRLRPLTDDRPKPMVVFHGKPFLEHMIATLRDAGIRRVLLLLGYRAEKVVAHFGDGRRFGVEITYAIGPVEDETGMRLARARAAGLIDPLFLLLYCDNIWPLELARMSAEYLRAGRRAMTTVYANDDGWTRHNVKVDGGRVVTYDRARRSPDLAGVDIGFGLFERGVLDLLPAGENVSFEASVYPQLIAAGELGAFVTRHRYYSIGSLERLPETTEFLARRKTVLLDRDGTLNALMPPAQYVTRRSEFRWLPGALDGLRALAQAGYRVAIVTNQPGVERGMLSASDLDTVHSGMIADARAAGGRIDAVFVCTHGWEAGCDCRKPRAGLLFGAQRELRLDLSRTTYIGDDERDGVAAQAAGAPFVRVGPGFSNIYDAVTAVIKGERQFANAS